MNGSDTIRGIRLVNINGNRRCIQYNCNNASRPSATTVSITVIKIRVNMQNSTISITDMSNTYDDVYTYTAYSTKYWHFVWEYDYRNVPITTANYRPHLSNEEKYGIDSDWLSFTYVNGDNFTSNNQINPDILRLEYGNCYKHCSTQLDTTADYVYEKTFYGKNGIENGTLTTNVSNLFTDVNAEVYAKIQQQYDNIQPRVLTDNDKTINKNIITIPCKTDGTPLLDTSNVTNMFAMFRFCESLTVVPLLDTSSATTTQGMFSACSVLTTVPVLNMSHVTNMYSMFGACPSLTNKSLNNIMQMCINATSYTGTKTLKYIGLTQTQATTCQGLSNYSAFISAGWTTGY